MSHHSSSLWEQTNLPELLFVYLPEALFSASLCLKEGRKRRGGGKVEGDDEMQSKTITQSRA